MAKAPKTTVLLTRVRMNYPSLYEKTAGASEDPNAEAKYRCVFTLDKQLNAIDIEKLKTEAKVQLNAEWPNGAWQAAGFLTRPMLKDGATKVNEDGSFRDGFGPGVFFINTASTQKPLVCNHQNETLPDNNTLLYAGCYVDVTVDLWVQNNKHGRCVNVNLRAVRFNDHGTPFGAAPVTDGNAEFGAAKPAAAVSADDVM